jgi:hypothetical protein
MKISTALLFIKLPCIPNAKVADGLGVHSDIFKFGLKFLHPPFGEFLVVERTNSDAAVQHWIITEIAQLDFPIHWHPAESFEF